MSCTFAMISLGCAKNLMDSENMLYLLTEAGHTLVPDPEGADFVLINTCGFIDSAKSEAIDNILEMAQLKNEGKLKKIIVSGCLTERYREQVREEMPEVDAILGVGSIGEIADIVEKTMAEHRPAAFGDKNAPMEEFGRVVSTGPGWAYIKIAEGCDNRCAYCAIPDIRGKFRSRPMDAVLAEANELVERGVKELIVVAQDITRWGVDIYGKPSLDKLLAELCKTGCEWIRLHYLYPDEITPELIDTIAREDKICKYLDIPIQHINNEILRRMNRRGTGEEIRELFGELRARVPGLVLRTSLIVGLPGEGEAEFEELCEFLREAKIERVGAFAFSPEEGTPAAEMTDRCDEDEAVRRQELVMELQADIMDEYNENRTGETLAVLCQGYDEDSGLLWGRSYADSPDIDGRIFFEGDAAPGEFTEVFVREVMDGELFGIQTQEK